MKKYFLSICFCLIASPALAEIDCATLPECADLGYTDEAANCPSGKVYCPFDTTKAKCVDPMVGEIVLWPGSSAPKGWMFCNGSLLAKADYPDLYNVIGTTYGYSGSSFRLPNFAGRVPVGVGTYNSSYSYYLGLTGGEPTHTLTISEMPKHNHAIYASSSNGKFGDNANHRPVPDLNGTLKNYSDWGVSPYTQYSGSSSAHENRQPYLVVNYIIFTGVY